MLNGGAAANKKLQLSMNNEQARGARNVSERCVRLERARPTNFEPTEALIIHAILNVLGRIKLN